MQKSEGEYKNELLVAYELGYMDGFIETKRLFDTKRSELPDAPPIRGFSSFIEQLRNIAKAKGVSFD